MLTRLATTLVRRRRLVLLLALAWFALAGVVGGGVAQHLSSGGFADPGAQSTRATNLLRDRFGAGDPNVILLVTARGGATVDSPAVVAAGQALTAPPARGANVVQAN